MTRSPVQIEVPTDGHWYVVVDLGGYKGRVKASVEIAGSDGHAVAERRTMAAG